MKLKEAKEIYRIHELETKLAKENMHLREKTCTNCKFHEIYYKKFLWFKYKHLKCLVKDKSYSQEDRYDLYDIYNYARAQVCPTFVNKHDKGCR